MASDRRGACYGQRPKWSLLWPATEVELAMASDRSGANPLFLLLGYLTSFTASFIE